MGGIVKVRNFSFNNQYLVSVEFKSSKKEKSKHKNYKILTFKDADTSRNIKLYYFGEDNIVDSDGEVLNKNTPYLTNGFVNNSNSNIFLNLENVKKDLKSFKKKQNNVDSL